MSMLVRLCACETQGYDFCRDINVHVCACVYADAFYLRYVSGGDFAGTYQVIEAARTGSCGNLLSATTCTAGNKLTYVNEVGLLISATAF